MYSFIRNIKKFFLIFGISSTTRFRTLHTQHDAHPNKSWVWLSYCKSMRECLSEISQEYSHYMLALLISSVSDRYHQLTEYCREEFEKFTTFLTPKKCRNWPVFGCNWPIFRVKKVVLVFVTIVTLRQ